ncbi:HTH-type transcriptional regulator ZntR [Ephemeroptericola cinctiostellae]|uniref:HTH-type transcriptional regulator ZntR n=1 Tax=Ephemeroptericola cinctiostellae TaxID=2268024 RepID=A0A345DDQ3_9BURK|nr:Cd(II)/Pb(II)-responsive transcriptional regulator [Ephemeroptericola cinctiostellae]AXF86491.1 HTH-type transcriptional regulator ZntR [Ephemeroptericola cinctiostellae]
MKISQLAAATGVAVETIRYYEQQNLLPLPERQDNGYRTYSNKHVEQLAFIKHCRSLDMSIADTGQLLAFTLEPQADCTQINLLVEQQLLKIRARLVSLTALEKQLDRLQHQCSQVNSSERCGILHELVAAAHGEACACHGLN